MHVPRCLCGHQKTPSKIQLSLLPYGSQISNTCLQAWQQGPLPTELPCQPETTLAAHFLSIELMCGTLVRKGFPPFFFLVSSFTALVIPRILRAWKYCGLGGSRGRLSAAECSAPAESKAPGRPVSS